MTKTLVATSSIGIYSQITLQQDVPKWLGLALNAPIMPMGLCQTEQGWMGCWLIQGQVKRLFS